MMLEEGHRDWSRTLTATVQVMNETENCITHYSPEALWGGNQIMWQAARTHIAAAQKQMNKRLETKRIYRKYQSGQQVWAYDFVRVKKLDDKFSPYWVGPWTLLEQKGRVLWKAHTHRG